MIGKVEFVQIAEYTGADLENDINLTYITNRAEYKRMSLETWNQIRDDIANAVADALR